MAANRSEKSNYESRFGGGWITASQYLAESMCDRQARKDGRSLGIKFWRTKEWDQQFRLQLKHASKLLQKFSAQSIIKALRTFKGKQVFSLGAPSLPKLIAPFEKTFESVKRGVEQAKRGELSQNPPNELDKPRPSFTNKPSDLSLLRKL